MRTIKFRYWEKPDTSVNFEGKMHYDSDEYFNKWCGNPEYETMQFTGLLDKNGKEIYEGDLVRVKGWQPEVYEVVFDRGGFCLKWGDDANFYNDIKYAEDDRGEIIGNIYEHPDLLKK